MSFSHPRWSQTWSPRVTASTPDSRSERAIGAGYAGAGGGVLAVRDHEVEALLAPHARHPLLDDLAAGLSHDVAYEKELEHAPRMDRARAGPPDLFPRLASGPREVFRWRAFLTKRPAMKTRTSPTPFPKAEIGHEMKGSDAVVECLIREGVDVIFAYPGGASQELHQSLARTDKIRVILPRHEQGGSFAAEGYARATGKVGVCMATSGPGATNLVSAIADAYMDSVPLVAITGQVKKEFIGKMAFQETDFFGMTLPS